MQHSVAGVQAQAFCAAPLSHLSLRGIASPHQIEVLCGTVGKLGMYGYFAREAERFAGQQRVFHTWGKTTQHHCGVLRNDDNAVYSVKGRERPGLADLRYADAPQEVVESSAWRLQGDFTSRAAAIFPGDRLKILCGYQLKVDIGRRKSGHG